MASTSSELDEPVVVCGAGAAGLAAALAAARCGVDATLVEATGAIGGTVAAALIHTLGGLYDSEGELLSGGLPAELIERLLRADSRTRRRKLGRAWVLNVCPAVYRAAVAQWLREEPRITVWCNARFTRLSMSCGRIRTVGIEHGGQVASCQPRAIIDATGSAEVARQIDERLVIDEDRRAAGGLIFRLRGIAPGALDFPQGLGVIRDLRAAQLSGRLPRECQHVWIDRGVADDEAFVKLMVPLGPRRREEAPAILARAQEVQAAVVEFLRGRLEFVAAEVVARGALGVRDGGRIRGRYTLTADDVRQGRKFADAAARCAWPIEYWDPDRGVSVEYLPPGVFYEIPLRAMQIAGVENFWVAGKCLSADRWAHASARVVGTCWAMGEAAGRAAANGLQLEEQHDVQPLRTFSADRPPAAGPPGDSSPGPRAAAQLPRAQ